MSDVESTADIFLIKPIYPSGLQLPQPLIVPANRKPPLSKAHSNSLSLPHFPPTKADFKRATTAHPAMHLVSALRSTASSRKQQRAETPHFTQTLPAHHQVPAEDAEIKWSVANSRVQSAAGHQSYIPILPKLVELETTPLREPGVLLRHLKTTRSSRRMHEQLPSLIALPKEAQILPPIDLSCQINKQIPC